MRRWTEAAGQQDRAGAARTLEAQSAEPYLAAPRATESPSPISPFSPVDSGLTGTCCQVRGHVQAAALTAGASPVSTRRPTQVMSRRQSAPKSHQRHFLPRRTCSVTPRRYLPAESPFGCSRSAFRFHATAAGTRRWASLQRLCQPTCQSRTSPTTTASGRSRTAWSGWTTDICARNPETSGRARTPGQSSRIM